MTLGVEFPGAVPAPAGGRVNAWSATEFRSANKRNFKFDLEV